MFSSYYRDLPLLFLYIYIYILSYDLFFYIIIKSINDAFLLTNKMAYWLKRRCAKFSTCL
jgi:hypothetical protein